MARTQKCKLHAESQDYREVLLKAVDINDIRYPSGFSFLTHIYSCAMNRLPISVPNDNNRIYIYIQFVCLFVVSFPLYNRGKLTNTGALSTHLAPNPNLYSKTSCVVFRKLVKAKIAKGGTVLCNTLDTIYKL